MARTHCALANAALRNRHLRIMPGGGFALSGLWPTLPGEVTRRYTLKLIKEIAVDCMQYTPKVYHYSATGMI